MRIELLFFLSVLLSGCILAAFFLQFLNSQQVNKIKKDIHLKKKKCDVCASIYFISPAVKYWRCPLCHSINKGIYENK